MLALTYAALLGVAVAQPWGPPGGSHDSHSSGGYGPGGYHSTSVSSAESSAQTPFEFPLNNGFPNITNPSEELNDIEDQAHGTLPNGPPPPSITEDTKTSLRLIAFNEIFEVAFFTDLIYNITNHVEGYDLGRRGIESFILKTLTAVQAQEELHALNANGALANFGEDPIQACKYVFPVDNFDDAINLASTFTDVVLGTLQDVQNSLGVDGDIGLIRGVGSVIGQEGEQNGYYRSLEGKIPSALPFLTTSTREFAFSALNQMFVVPGSCPNENEIALPIFGALTVDTKNIEPKNQTLTFTVKSDSLDGDSLVYINQQNLPVVEDIENIKKDGGYITFDAFFPFDALPGGMNGLTIAAVTNSSGPFDSANAVANATVFGPGLIEIN